MRIKNIFNIEFFALSAGVIAFFFVSFVDLESSSISVYNEHGIIKYSTGSPVGKTGAPGEGTCVNCHAGNVMNGDAQNQFTFSGLGNEYQIGQSYTITISVQNPGITNGFQIVALDDANENIGILSPGIGSIAETDAAKIYINQNDTGLNSWTINWEAPETNQGPVTFYLATNKGDGDGLQIGDEIYNSQHVVNPSVAGIYFNEYVSLDENLEMSFNPFLKTIDIYYALKKSSSIAYQLVDMNGRIVDFKSIGMVGIGKNEHSFNLSNNINKGGYISTLFINNHIFTRTLNIQ